jgi:hypothetical protein
MVTDSGRFKYSGVNGDTLRCAAELLDIGIDTETLYANLYLDTYESLKFTAHVYEKMQQTENGVSYIFVDKAMQEQFNLTLEQASACVNDMDSIRGNIAWIAFIETGDEKDTIRVRLRSRFVHINGIAEKYRGGGHACASGATLYGKDEIALLLQDADVLLHTLCVLDAGASLDFRGYGNLDFLIADILQQGLNLVICLLCVGGHRYRLAVYFYTLHVLQGLHRLGVVSINGKGRFPAVLPLSFQG